jgi:hypothetical protein
MGVRFTVTNPKDRESLDALLSVLDPGRSRVAERPNRLMQLLNLLQAFQREVPGMNLDPSLADSVDSVLRSAKTALEALQEGLKYGRSSLVIKAAIDSAYTPLQTSPHSSEVHENRRAN